MEQTRITVVIPVYNIEPYIKECLDSVTAQSYSNLEILAVNDGSTDNGRKVIEKCAEKDIRIRILDKPNGGLSDARNFGISKATGDYICFIDGDDTIHRTYIQKLFQALGDDSDIAVCDMEYVYDDGHKEYSSGGIFTKTNVQETPSLIRINNSACNKLYRTNLFKEIQYPKGKLYEDLATVPIQIYRSRNVVKVNEPLYYYRQRSGSIQHHVDDRVFHIYEAIDRVLEYVKTHGNEPSVISEIMHMYIIFGLDITTLKIKDMDEKEKRIEMLETNMNHLIKRYPDFQKDKYFRKLGLKKWIIFQLLSRKRYEMVLKIYDR